MSLLGLVLVVLPTPTSPVPARPVVSATGRADYLRKKRMHQPQENLCIARLSGYGQEAQCVGSYMFLLSRRMLTVAPNLQARLYDVSKSRIHQMRNMSVEAARKLDCRWLYMIDPDAVADPYVKYKPEGGYRNRFRPFFDAAWGFMQAHKDDVGPCVLAAPACGLPPARDVQVFRKHPADRNGKYRLVKIPRQEAAGLTGWHRVGAVGSHMLFIDMRVFDKLNHPFFHDVFKDQTHTDLLHGQDVKFCRKCTEAKIPIFVNFNCWSDHFQYAPVRRPGVEEQTEEQPTRG